jgi:hypothetical protein
MRRKFRRNFEQQVSVAQFCSVESRDNRIFRLGRLDELSLLQEVSARSPHPVNLRFKRYHMFALQTVPL